MNKSRADLLVEDIDDIPSYETLDKVEEDLYESGSSNTSHNINNIFPLGANSNQEVNNIFLLKSNTNPKAKNVIKNKTKFPNAFKDISLVFSKKNISRILNGYHIVCNDSLLSNITRYGKGKDLPTHVNEVEELVRRYVKVVAPSNANTLSYDEDVITSFISLYKSGKIGDVITFYTKKANGKNKRNSTTVGVKNIICNINVEKLREHCFGVTPDCVSFDPHEDRELFILDYIKMFWEFYMLLVFCNVCGISRNNEEGFFLLFQQVILLAIFTGMTMFLELELNCCYGELYEELKGFKPYNEDSMYVDVLQDKQQIQFIIENSHFLNEAYIKEYNYPLSIKETKDIKEDKETEITLCVQKGSTNKSIRVEVQFSGQYAISRIYSSTADKEANINLFNLYNYGLSTDKPILYLLKQILNYSYDNEEVSYYTKLVKYLNKKKDKLQKYFVDKTLSVILLILHKRPNEAELKAHLDKYFKPTDKQVKADVRRIYNELIPLLKPKKVRLIDKFRRELDWYVW